MAISLKTAGTWARMVTDNGTVAIPGSPASGDRMFLFGAWKTYTITVATPDGWTPIGDEYADGATAAGNGTGSMKVRAFYRDWVSGDSAPAIDYSTAPTEGFWVINLWQKGAGDTWASPSIVNGAIAAADPFTVDAASTVTVPDGSVVMCLVAFRDDSSTMTRATDALDDTGGLVTWNGDHVEAPATHISSTTGQDAAADLGHRLVTTGATGVTLHADGDLSASESGAALFLIQGLFVSDPKTAAPTAGSLTLTGGTPAVTTPVAAEPTAGSMTLTGATPAVATTANVTSEPTAASLALTGATPAAATPVLAQPTAGALALTGDTPAVTVANNVTSLPTPAALALTGATPAVAAAQTYEPTPASLALSGATPAVSAAQTYEPTSAAMVLTGETPAVNVGASITAIPTAASLTLTPATPAVAVSDNVIVLPTAGSLALTGATPAVVATAHQRVTPTGAVLTLVGSIPAVTGGTVAASETPSFDGRRRRREEITDPLAAIYADDDDVLLVLYA